MKTNDNAPAVYVGTWAKYNAGSLAGGWLYFQDYETEAEFLEACRALHADEADPELMFQDYDNTPDELCSETNPDFAALKLYAELCGEYDPEAVAAFCDCYEVGRLDEFEDLYCGYYAGGMVMDSRESFAYDMAAECWGDAIDRIGGYFDYAAFARYLFITDYTESNGYIFRCA